MEREERNQV